MNILVIGCGKVGSKLACELARRGHDVSVVDKQEENFKLLDDDFNGFTFVGVPIDQDALRQAGIESCDALAAVTQDDNINIMVSQLAREVFSVPQVLARIYDPKREDVFSHFGLQTVCPTNLTVGAVSDALTRGTLPKQVSFGTSTVAFVEQDVPQESLGLQLSEFECDPEDTIFGVIRPGGQIILYANNANYKLSTGDRFIFARQID